MLPKSVPASREETSLEPGEETKPEPVHRMDPFASPAKGILLTPGTTATRRKTVSFGKLGANTEAEHQDSDIETTTKNVSCTEYSNKTEADIRCSLFQAKTSTEKPVTNDDAKNVQDRSKSDLSGKKEGTYPVKDDQDNTTSDITIDLKSPRSKSGQHWKREYQRDHDKSKLEMRKLIRYSQLTKSYAIKRDGDALRLAEKLRSAEATVQEMESRVSGLASQLMDAKTQGEKQAEILNELATQTAQALRYKQKVERYRHALLSQDLGGVTSLGVGAGSTCEDQPELPSLRSEISSLQTAAKKAEGRALELERENDALKHTLARVKEEMKRYETRHSAREESRKRKDEKSAAQKKSLREQLANARAENKRLQEKAQARTTQYDSTTPQAIAMNEVPEQAVRSKNSNLIETYQLLREPSPNSIVNQNVVTVAKPLAPELGLHGQDKQVGNTQNGTEAIYSASKGQRPEQHTQPAFPRQMVDEPTSSHHIGSLRDGAGIWLQSADTSQDTKKNQPDLESARVLNPVHQNPARISQQTFGMIKTPPGDKTQSSSYLVERRENRPFPRNQTSSLGKRTPLPPDRVAAAKKRLEQRSVERRKPQDHGKENRRPAS